MQTLELLTLLITGILQIVDVFGSVIVILAFISIIILKVLLTQPKTKIHYHTKNELEELDCIEDCESVTGHSNIKKRLVTFLKDKDVSVELQRKGLMTKRIYHTIEGYPYTVNMNRIQDLNRKKVNEEFFSLFKNKALPDIVAKIIYSGLKTQLIGILFGLCLGLLIGFLGAPFYLTYFGFL